MDNVVQFVNEFANLLPFKLLLRSDPDSPIALNAQNGQARFRWGFHFPVALRTIHLPRMRRPFKVIANQVKASSSANRV